MSLLSMTWRDVLFAHWGVDPGLVQPRLPDGIDVDTHDGRAWLGVVAFVMEDIRPSALPRGLTFPELNLRTYVTHESGKPGIYFFNLDAADPLGVAIARRAFRLPYYRASMHAERRETSVAFRSRRTHTGQPPMAFDATYGPASGGIEDRERADFLTERYRFYTASDGGTVYAGDVGHERWPLRPGRVEFRRNECFRANGFDHPGGDPLVHYAPTVDVTARRLERL